MQTMSPPQPHSSYNNVVADFLESLKGLYVPGILCQSPNQAVKFIPPASLEQFMSRTVVSNILESLFPDSPLAQIPDATRVQRKCRKVFCILLRIGRGTWIDEFLKNGAYDEKLPFNDSGGRWPTSATDFFEIFKKEQWAFSAPTLEITQDHRFDQNEIIPIFRKEEIRKGGCATIFKIEVHSELDSLANQDSLKEVGDSPNHIYALKTYYGRTMERHYHSEIAAYESIRRRVQGRNTGLTEYHGSFRQGDTYNILLEYAEGGSLEDHFSGAGPRPRTSAEIHKFYKALFNALDGLHSIHQPTSQVGHQFMGIHQDVKPPNILYVGSNSSEPFAGKYKLSDPGLSQFSGPAHSDRRFLDAGGTKTYGAPECYRPSSSSHKWNFEVTPKADIWSLGCVFHEAITWAILGKDALEKYRHGRAEETRKVPGFRDGNCFHNGSRRLDMVDHVNGWILEAVKSREDGPTTRKILALIDGMMDYEESRRHSAIGLLLRWAQIMEAANDELKRVPGMTLDPPPKTPPGIPPYRAAPLNPDESRSPLPHIGDQDHRVSDEDYQVDYSSDSPRSEKWDENAVQYNAHSTQGRAPVVRTASSPHGMKNRRIVTRNSFPARFGVDPRSSPVTNAPAVTPPPHDTTPNPYLLNSSQTMPLPGTQHRNQQHNKPDRHVLAVNHHSIEEDMPGPALPRSPTPTNVGRLSASEPPANTYGKRLNRDVPMLKVSVALNWRQRRKQRRFFHRDPPDELPFAQLQHVLGQRDHVFLIDDSARMSEFWNEATILLDILVYLVKKSDKNGVDMYFTTSDGKFTSKDTSTLVNIMKSKEDAVFRNTSDFGMGSCLGRILGEYQPKLERSRAVGGKTVQPLNVYIFTTGNWQNNTDASIPIVSLVQTLDAYRHRPDQVGIQFIRFGNDDMGTAVLTSLDDDLDRQGDLRDIVDTEPSNGNVWKMLLGGTDKSFDVN